MDNRTGLTIGLLAIAASFGSLQQQYVGADAALRKIEVPLPEKAHAPQIADPFASYLKEISRFRRESLKMSPPEVAKGWLRVVDHCPKTESWPISTDSNPNLAFADAMSALPPPATWGEIEKVLVGRLRKEKDATKDRLLLALVETLRGERDMASLELSKINGLPPESNINLAKIQVDLALLDERPDQIESALHRLIAALNAEPRSRGVEHSIELPDLDRTMGPARARKLLTYAFQTFDGEVVVKKSDRFAGMARGLAIEMVAKLKHPQWSLVTDLSAGPLFEVLQRRFPDSISGVSSHTWQSGSYRAAAMRYVIYLITQDRLDAAAKFLKREEPDQQFTKGTFGDETPLLVRIGKIESCLQFMEREIANGEIGWLINPYYALCQSVGQTKRAETFVEKVPAAKRTVFYFQVDKPINDLIASGNLEKAGRLLAGRLSETSNESNLSDASSKLVEIGRALKRPDWVELGIRAAERAYQTAIFGSPENWICFDLAEHGRAKEAERIVADVLQKRTHDGTTSSTPAGQEELLTLMRVYAIAGRWRDLLTILEEAPNLGENDVAFLQDYGPESDSLAYLTSQALASVGRREEALHVLHFDLESDPDDDRAYSLLLQLDPMGAGTQLDAIRRAAPMAPRPRIWKAEWLRRNHQLAAAERTIREAIALDPEDTLTFAFGIRKRFRAWQILADIERDEGKTAHAGLDRRIFTDQAKASVPMGLDLDGPANRVQALSKNPDDLINRLAVADDFEHDGKSKEALETRSQAAHLAATHFGPASSAYWSGFRATRYPILERVLSLEVTAHPGRASTLAALGTLYDNMDEVDKAKETYTKAVTFDPNFLAAWRGLMGLQQNISLSRGIKEEMVSNFARLAPRELCSANWDVRDLAAVWNIAHTAFRDLPQIDEPIFHLPMSSLGNSADPRNNEGTRRTHWPQPTAGSVVAADRTISAIAELFGAIAQKTVERAN